MVLHFYESHNLGDCVFFIHYCRKLIQLSKEYKIFFYVRELFVDELNKHVSDIPNITILNMFDRPPEAMDVHPNTSGTYVDKLMSLNNSFIDYYTWFFKNLSKQIGVESPIKNRQDMLIDNHLILKNNVLSDKFDILIINSMPMSNQIDFDNNIFVSMINNIKSANPDVRIITTNDTNIPDVPCTMDFGLSLIDIGNLSLYCDYIIGIHTSPIIYTYNVWNINKVKKWYLLHKDTILHNFNERCLSYNNISIVENMILNDLSNG